jgi:hypothetical protein
MTGPDFLGIGAQRAGTTWLHHRLSRHPDIFLPAAKELHFFDEKPDLSGYQGLGQPGRPFYYNLNSPEEWEWYRRQFEPGAGFKVRGEMTPYYATLSEPRVALIASRMPRLKIIYTLRNPVQRAWSGFRLFWFLEKKNQGCHLETELIQKTIMHPAKLIHGDYQRNIAVWEKHFSPGQILYLFFDDLVESPQAVMNKVFEFLGVPPVPQDPAEIGRDFNRAPALEMPGAIAAGLAEYYAGQARYIEHRFGRTLKY